MRAKFINESVEIVNKKDIVDLIYLEYPQDDPFSKKVIEKVKKRIMKWSEEKFLDYVNSKGIFTVERLRKNAYYIK